MYRELEAEPWGWRHTIAQGWRAEQPLTSDLFAVENIILTTCFTKLFLKSQFKCLVMTSVDRGHRTEAVWVLRVSRALETRRC